jgi:hypothetical protein
MQFAIGGNSMPGQTRATRVRLQKSSTATTNASFRVHLYGAAPASTTIDQGTWLTDTSAQYLGGFDIGSMYAFSDGAAQIGIPTTGNGNDVLLRLNAGKTIYGVLGARGLYADRIRVVYVCARDPGCLLGPCTAYRSSIWRE